LTAQIIPYSIFKKKRREKKYGTDASRLRRLKAMGYPDDFYIEIQELDYLLYGEDEEEEEDYWLGERPLTTVIK